MSTCTAYYNEGACSHCSPVVVPATGTVVSATRWVANQTETYVGSLAGAPEWIYTDSNARIRVNGSTWQEPPVVLRQMAANTA